MNYKIDLNILTQTNQCSNNFSCLFGATHCTCEIEKLAGADKDLLFVVPNGNNKCNYIMDFGRSWICNCPTRLALCQEYGF